MKIKLIRPAIVGGKSRKVTGKQIEVDVSEAKVLIATGKAVSMEPKKEEGVILSVSPKDLEAVKQEMKAKDDRIAELESALKQTESKDA